jgi:transcriptional regulator with GAF, ATPase, and Fis domain
MEYNAPMSRQDGPKEPTASAQGATAQSGSRWKEGRATHAIEEDHPIQAVVKGFTLVVTRGPDDRKTFSSSAERAILGTHESADFVLRDPTVSRFHCELAVTGGRVSIRDLESTNGTTVNGTAVLHAYLEPGARLNLGHTELRFELQAESMRLPLSANDQFGSMVGRSVAMRRIFATLERVAKADSTVLLEGETGTGKEAAAESIHRESRRRDAPFVVVDCAAIPSTLLESELFGHERGAFTGATSSRAGVFEMASTGTLFLDEIGELSLDLQPKLLRVLEQREIKRVGGDRFVPVDVRIVAATNRSLRAEVNDKRFRSDLYYRLAIVEIRVPPLRERVDDLPLLVDSLLSSLGASEHVEAKNLRTPSFLADLARHAWPGNIRELRNYVERCIALGENAPLRSDLPESNESVPDMAQPLKIARERWTRAFERKYVEQMLARHGNNVAAAAREAGVDRMYFYRLLWRYGLR